ncbi:hypothetical protein ACFX15_005969 [Malus domestica]
MEIFASSNRRSTLTVFMALAPNLHEPSWTTRSLFKKNSSNTEIASSSLAPHTRQYMQRKDLFMPSAAPASVYASSVILLAPPANLPSRPPSSTSSSSPSSSTSSPSSRSSPTSSPKTPALSPLPSKLHGYASPAAPASVHPCRLCRNDLSPCLPPCYSPSIYIYIYINTYIYIYIHMYARRIKKGWWSLGCSGTM